jgi:hypothetical protein
MKFKTHLMIVENLPAEEQTQLAGSAALGLQTLEEPGW